MTTHPDHWTDEELALRIAYEQLPRRTMPFEKAAQDALLGPLLRIRATAYLRHQRDNKNGEEPDDEHLSVTERRRAARDAKGGSPVD